jgi:uncharacterized membrane protein YphA (DoxX/SURF4 family)
MSASAINEPREWGITVLRVGTGASFLIHDGETILHKLIYHPEELVSLRSGQVILLSLCGAALVLGLFTRWVSVVLATGMLVDILFVEWPSSLFSEPGSQDLGFEYASLRLIASLALVLAGPGRAALDCIVTLPQVPLLARLQR